MKTLRLSAIAALIITAVCFIACTKNEQEGRKQTGYEEYTMTVASKKLEGVAGVGSNSVTMVYAIKRSNAAQWSSFYPTPEGFEYEQGYEYSIKVAQTNWLDYRMGDPAWSEYELLDVISKIEKESEGLPENLIPDWYKEQ